MIVDTHTHLLSPTSPPDPWLVGERMAPLRRDFTAAELAAVLAAGGVGAALLVQTRSSEQETSDLLNLAERAPWVAGVVGWCDLRTPDCAVRLAGRLAGAGGRWLVGLRHQAHDEPDPDWLARPEVGVALTRLGAADLTYDLLIRERELPAALAVVQAHPEVRFVIDHGAKPDLRAGPSPAWTEGMRALAACPNTWVKLSGLITEADWQAWTPAQVLGVMQDLLAWFGPQRCLYGSDWPVCTLAGEYGDVLRLSLDLTRPLSTAERAQILCGNAQRAYPRLTLPELV